MKHAKFRFEYSQITPYIFVGTNMCCTVHLDKSLMKKGIRADISLEEERIDAPFGANYYFWLPTKDHTAISFAAFITAGRVPPILPDS